MFSVDPYTFCVASVCEVFPTVCVCGLSSATGGTLHWTILSAFLVCLHLTIYVAVYKVAAHNNEETATQTELNICAHMKKPVKCSHSLALSYIVPYKFVFSTTPLGTLVIVSRA